MDNLFFENEFKKFDEKDLGRCIRRERHEQNMTLEDLAKRSLVSRSYLSQVERGERSMTIDFARRIAYGLRRDPEELFLKETSLYESEKAYEQLASLDVQESSLPPLGKKAPLYRTFRQRKISEITDLLQGCTEYELRILCRFIRHWIAIAGEKYT